MTEHSSGGRIVHTRSGIGTYARIAQAQELAFNRIFVDAPTLIVVHRGTKTVRAEGHEWLLRSNEAIALTGGCSYDFINSPGSDVSYAAEWLFWDSSLIAPHWAYEDPLVTKVAPAFRLGAPGTEFLGSFARAKDAVISRESMPSEIAAHRVSEMLVWLSSQGVRFAGQEKASLKTRIRRMIESNPAKKWTIDSVAANCALSGTSLRRRLAQEGTTLGNLLIDTRMSLAVTLLQSTDAPIINIAFDLGYESASRFSIRFRERFGFPPTAIRGHNRSAQTASKAL